MISTCNFATGPTDNDLARGKEEWKTAQLDINMYTLQSHCQQCCSDIAAIVINTLMKMN